MAQFAVGGIGASKALHSPNAGESEEETLPEGVQ